MKVIIPTWGDMYARCRYFFYESTKVDKKVLRSRGDDRCNIQKSKEGTPQGGPLSPLLSNVILDKLDKELERRGHKFCRYADDCNIYVRTKRSAERVMGICQYKEKLLENRQ